MNKLGLSRNFEYLECCDVRSCKALLINVHSTDWSRKIHTVPNVRTYITFKNTYTVEKNVLSNLSRTERSVLPKSDAVYYRYR